jgi:hypothetical protein
MRPALPELKIAQAAGISDACRELQSHQTCTLLKIGLVDRPVKSPSGNLVILAVFGSFFIRFCYIRYRPSKLSCHKG